MTELAKTMQPLIVDKQSVERFAQTFHASNDTERMRAFISRFCFLAWVGMGTVKPRTSEGLEQLRMAFLEALRNYRIGATSWTLEEFYSDLCELRLLQARLRLEEGRVIRDEKYNLVELAEVAMNLRSSSYSEMFKDQKDLSVLFGAIGASIQQQVTAVAPIVEGAGTEWFAHVSCLNDEFTAVFQLG